MGVRVAGEQAWGMATDGCWPDRWQAILLFVLLDSHWHRSAGQWNEGHAVNESKYSIGQKVWVVKPNWHVIEGEYLTTNPLGTKAIIKTVDDPFAHICIRDVHESNSLAVLAAREGLKITIMLAKSKVVDLEMALNRLGIAEEGETE